MPSIAQEEIEKIKKLVESAKESVKSKSKLSLSEPQEKVVIDRAKNLKKQNPGKDLTQTDVEILINMQDLPTPEFPINNIFNK